MGMYDADPSILRVWTLMNGEPVTWFNWNGDQPNGFGSGKSARTKIEYTLRCYQLNNVGR